MVLVVVVVGMPGSGRRRRRLLASSLPVAALPGPLAVGVSARSY
jgi:hypothetical protein